MSDEKKTFTVSDRRHFTAEGEARPDAPADVPDEESAAPPSPGPMDAGKPGADLGSDFDGEHETPDLSSLLLSLGAQASMLLGLSAEGDSEPPDLQGASGIISLLEVLEVKTRGNRTPDEDRLIGGLLYELRLAFVSRARQAGA